MKIHPLTLRRQIPTANRISQMGHATAILVVARQHPLVVITAIRRPAVGEMTVGHRPHHTHVESRLPTAGVMTVVHRPYHVTLVGTRLHTAGVLTAGRHRLHLALVGMMIGAMMMINAVAMVEIAVSRLRGIVDAVTRFRGVHLAFVDVMNANVHRHHVERVVESGTAIGTAHLHVLVIMTAEEMVRGRDTGITAADTNNHVIVHLLSVSTLFRL